MYDNMYDEEFEQFDDKNGLLGFCPCKNNGCTNSCTYWGASCMNSCSGACKNSCSSFCSWAIISF